MQTPNWREEIVKRYEEDADVHSPANFTAMLRAIDSAYKVGKKESIELAIEVVRKEMDEGSYFRDNEFVACDDLTSRIIKALKTLLH